MKVAQERRMFLAVARQTRRMIGAIAFFILGVALWLGPGFVAAILAKGNVSWRRAVYAMAAGAAALPFVVQEIQSIVEAVRSFDGLCRHPPDIVYACSLGQKIFEYALPLSPFGLFGFLVLGIPACLWGCFWLVAAMIAAKYLRASGANPK